jgi:hypothetical protein
MCGRPRHDACVPRELSAAGGSTALKRRLLNAGLEAMPALAGTK